jgi:STE24 endopeptidase
MIIFHISILIMILVLNILMPIFIRTYILRFYKKQKTANVVLYRLKFLQQYIQNVVIILSMFLFTFSVSKIMARNEINKIILMMTPFLFLLLVVIINQILYHNVYRIIRNTEMTVMEDIIEVAKDFLLLMLPSFLLTIFKIEILNRLVLNQTINFAAIALLIIIINVMYPYIVKFFIGAKHLKSKDLGDALNNNMVKQGIKNVEIYEWSSTKSKVANALVCGVFVKKIFISDYLIKNLSVKEIESVLAHEVGHLKGFHLWIKIALIILAFPIFTALGSIMDNFEEITMIKIPIPLGIGLFFLAMIFYFSFLYMFFSRIQERQADKYVIKSGIDINTYISALRKIAKLNDTMNKTNKFDDKFQTHPSFEKRINWLQKVL